MFRDVEARIGSETLKLNPKKGNTRDIFRNCWAKGVQSVICKHRFFSVLSQSITTVSKRCFEVLFQVVWNKQVELNEKKTHAHLTLVGRFLFYRNPIQNHIQNHITQKNLETEKTRPENYVKPTLIMWLNLQGFVVFIKCSMNPLETQFNRVFLIECFQSSVFNRVFLIECFQSSVFNRVGLVQVCWPTTFSPKFNDCAGYVYTQKKCSKFASRRVFSGPTLEVRPFEMNWWKKHKNDAIALKRLAMPPIIWHHWMNNLTLDKVACLKTLRPVGQWIMNEVHCSWNQVISKSMNWKFR